MALALEDWLVAQNIWSEATRQPTKSPWYIGCFQARYVGEKTEGEFIIGVYERAGVRYEMVYEMKLGTWTTPAGEVWPCTQKTKVLTGLRFCQRDAK